jgi:hypothetical protein
MLGRMLDDGNGLLVRERQDDCLISFGHLIGRKNLVLLYWHYKVK